MLTVSPPDGQGLHPRRKVLSDTDGKTRTPGRARAWERFVVAAMPVSDVKQVVKKEIDGV